MNTNNNLETYIVYLDEEKMKRRLGWRTLRKYSKDRSPLRILRMVKSTKRLMAIIAELKPKNDGLYITFYKKGGHKKIEVKWLDGKIIGDYKTWYENGNPSLIISFKNGLRDGLFKSFYQNGHPEYEITFKEDKKNGISKYWSKKGNLKTLKTFKNGFQDGVTQSYYPNGILEEESHFKNGEYLKSIHWDTNGDLLNGVDKIDVEDWKSISTYKNGIELNRVEKKYFKGKLEYEHNYKLGKLDGVCKEWIYNIGAYKQSSYHLISEEIYKNGKLNGVCKYYERYEGKIESIKIYKDNNLISERFPNKNYHKDDSSIISKNVNVLDNDYENESFGKYQGSYAQDKEGLSDNFIDDALDGDPDNYWNID
jgi:antitoxin component YwqK of YwqJK toxin-antitoxin module